MAQNPLHNDLIITQNLKDEPLLNPNPSRFVVFPVQYQDIWQMYKKALSTFWTAETVNLGNDLLEYNKLCKNERHFIKNVLAFFVVSDIKICLYMAKQFIREVQVAELRCFYGFQIAIANIHSEMYSLLINTYIPIQDKRENFFNTIKNIPYIKKKALWSMEWTKNASFGERIVANVAVEGIFFSGFFAAIFWIKFKVLIPGLSFSNELILRDKGLHCDFACLLFKYIENKPKTEKISQIIIDAVLIEQELLTDVLPVNLIGINCDIMKRYIEYVADSLLIKLECQIIFGAKNPFEFMKEIFFERKSILFHNTVADDNNINAMSKDCKEKVCVFDAEF